MISSADLEKAINGAIRSNQAATSQVQGIEGSIQATLQQAALAMRDAGSDASLAQAAVDEGTYQQQLAKRKSAQAYGLDMATQAAEIQKRADELKAAQAAGDEALAVINEKRSVGLLDDPIAAILNSLTINDDIKRYNAAQSVAAKKMQDVEQLSASARMTAENQYAITSTEASRAANARLAAAQWNVKATELDLQARNSNIRSIQAAQTASNQALEYLFKLNSAQNSAEQLALSRKSAERDAERHAVVMKEHKDNQQYHSSVLDAVNKGRELRGLPPLDGIKTSQVIGMLKAKGEIPEEFQADFRNGQTVVASGGFGRLSNTPAQLASLSSRGGLRNLPPEVQKAAKLSEEVMAVATQLAGNQKDAKKQPIPAEDVIKNPVMWNEVMRQAEAQVMNKYMAKPDALVNNPYKVPNLMVLAANTPALQNTAVYQKVLKPLADAGVVFDSGDRYWEHVKAAVASGKLTFMEAWSDTPVIWRRAVAMNNELRQFKKLGMPPATSYVVQGDWVGAVDLTDGVLVGRNLLQSQPVHVDTTPRTYQDPFTGLMQATEPLRNDFGRGSPRGNINMPPPAAPRAPIFDGDQEARFRAMFPERYQGTPEFAALVENMKKLQAMEAASK